MLKGPPSDPPPRSKDLATTRVIPVQKAPELPANHSACLVVIVGPKIGRQLFLDEPIEIGRDPNCNAHFNSDKVSRRHARILSFDGKYQLLDLGSTNGTFVNESKVRTAQLRDGDRIGVGDILLKFLDSDNIEAQYHKEIYSLMTTDGLTGIGNKRHFQEGLAHELSQFALGRSQLSVLLFDVDHFKRINDTYGHAAGDAVLRQLAQTVHALLTPEHLLGRIGGEEFAILLNGLSLGESIQVAERLRQGVERSAFQFESLAIPATLSIGIAHLPQAGPAASATELLKRADEALYRAKQTGRNRVCY